MNRLLVLISVAVLALGNAVADEVPVPKPLSAGVKPAESPATSATEFSTTGPAARAIPERHLLLCCGLPGDDEHRERLTDACRKVLAAAERVLGIPPERVRFLAGDDRMRADLEASADDVGICTKESVKDAMRALADSVPEDEACWVILLGHSHLYGSRCQFNIQGPDIDQTEFGNWAKPLQCREQVFVITTPISGFWLRPLRGSNRFVMTATEADLEFTGTEMPYALADVLAGESSHVELGDIDRDKEFSLLDLYLAANLEVHGRFKALERLQTEHAQLDDNGDGRGSEVQQSYLPQDPDEEDGDAAQSPEIELLATMLPRPISNPNLDGFRSRRVLLIMPKAANKEQ